MKQSLRSLSLSDVQTNSLRCSLSLLLPICLTHANSGMRQRQNERRKLDDAYKFVTRQSLRWSALFPTPSIPAEMRYAFQTKDGQWRGL
jgi:hypothetical protein